MIQHTPINDLTCNPIIGMHSSILTIGSCFSDEVGTLLKDDKFKVLANPFGTSYNPISIFKNLLYAIQGKPVDQSLYISDDETWNHFDFHSDFWAFSKAELEQKIQFTYNQVRDYIKTADVLIITLGTSVVYTLDNQSIVNNCHKKPSSIFNKRLLNMEEINTAFDTLKKELYHFNPSLQIVLTISPVRHIRDGMQTNQISKSLLRLFCKSVETTTIYFPSYEIMIDDLRDYQYYKEDLIHPNAQAVQYIYKNFEDTFFTSECKNTLESWRKIRNNLNHRIMKPGTKSHLKFLEHLLKDLQQIQKHLNVSEELNRVQKQLDELKS